MPDSHLGELIRSLVSLNDDDPTTLAQRFGARSIRAASAAAFSLAVERQFGATASPLAVAEFVAEIRGRYPNGSMVDPILAEALIRSALGESGLLDSSSTDNVISTEIFFAWAILDSISLSSAELDQFIAEATQCADEALSR